MSQLPPSPACSTPGSALGRYQRRPKALEQTEALIAAEPHRAPRLVVATVTFGLRPSALHLLHRLWAPKPFPLVLVGDTALDSLLDRPDLVDLRPYVTRCPVVASVPATPVGSAGQPRPTAPVPAGPVADILPDSGAAPDPGARPADALADGPDAVPAFGSVPVPAADTPAAVPVEPGECREPATGSGPVAEPSVPPPSCRRPAPRIPLRPPLTLR